MAALIWESVFSNHQTPGTLLPCSSTFREDLTGAPPAFSRDRQSVVELFTSSDHEFADLDRDGVYEPIAWNRRPFDVRCDFGIFGGHFYPEVFVPTGANYRKAWPPSDWPPPDLGLNYHLRNRARNTSPRG